MADEISSSESEDSGPYWVEWFIGLRGNELFCEVDGDYIIDKFNLTGLSADVEFYSQALDVIVDAMEAEEIGEADRAVIERSARHLYGLIHARFILTGRGLVRMLEKFKYGKFGKCPRSLCQDQFVLPIGLTDVPRMKCVKLYCPKCEDVYDPPRKYASIDGAYFGSTFPHLFLQTYPQCLPQKAYTLYKPHIFGFRVHQYSEEHRFQENLRDSMLNRLQRFAAEEKDIDRRKKNLITALSKQQNTPDEFNDNK